MANEQQLIVTPEQYVQGYQTFPGQVHNYSLIRKLADGNYLVKAPE